MAKAPEPRDALTVRVEPVEPDRWPELEGFFESRGSPHYCWCMVWRDMPTSDRKDKSKKKAAFKAHVLGGVPVGLLAYDGEAPIGWCAVGPKSSVPRLSKARGADADPNTWTISCFFVNRRYRQRGLTTKLIEAAVAYAKEQGATTIEAYPVAADAPSYRFLGFVKHFAAQGFREEGRYGAHRHIMRRPLI